MISKKDFLENVDLVKSSPTRVLVEPVDIDESVDGSDGKILRIESQQEGARKAVGLVISAGIKCEFVKEGDYAFFLRSMLGQIITFSGKDYVIMNESSILCKIEPQ